MKRRKFLFLSSMSVPFLLARKAMTSTNKKLPTYFIGHGSPMNAIQDNEFTRTLKKESQNIPDHIRAILVVSAHWETNGTYVTNNSPDQKLIYDFRGFPEELYKVQYPAKGSKILASEIAALNPKIKETSDWGLDHGTWCILKDLCPNPRVPILQLSIDRNLSLKDHLIFAQELKELRSKGFLVIGSGNIVHNLRTIQWEHTHTYDWAIEFDLKIKKAIENFDLNALTQLDFNEPATKLSVPTAEHYIPLIYTMALSEKGEKMTPLFEGHQNGSISMRSFKVG